MYNILASYDVINSSGIDSDLDAELDNLVGRKHQIESLDFVDNERDLSWIFASYDDANEAKEKLEQHCAVTKTFVGEIN